MSESTSEQLISQIEDALAVDGVWISDALRVSESDEASIEESVAAHNAQAAGGPAQVVLIDLDYDDLLTGGDTDQLAGIIHDDTGVDGVYLGLAHTYDEDGTVELQVRSFPDDVGLYQAARIAKVEHPHDLAAQIDTALTAIDAGNLDAQWEEAKSEHPQNTEQYYPYEVGVDPGSSAGGGHDDGSPVLPITASVVGVLVIAVLGIALVRQRRVSAPGSRVTGFELPPAVISAVLAAEDARTEAVANAEALVLAERIGAESVTVRTTATLSAWQEALDHYEVARRILERSHSPADTVGALVLVRRGASALDVATAGTGARRSWTPPQTCYFNQLHIGRTHLVEWSTGEWISQQGPSVTVPACAACAEAVNEGREPRDVLDFVDHGRPRHYFNLDLGAWSATGYGALDPDLLGRLIAG